MRRYVFDQRRNCSLTATALVCLTYFKTVAGPHDSRSCFVFNSVLATDLISCCIVEIIPGTVMIQIRLKSTPFQLPLRHR